MATPVRADTCSDLQAAIAKATALKGQMQREAGPILLLPKIPARSEAACKASQTLRDHIVVVTKLIDTKCLNDEQHQNLTKTLNKNMREANGNVGLFCN